MRRSCPYIRHLLLQLLNSWLWIEWLVLECIILAILVSTFHLKVICLMNSSTFLKNAREYLAIDHYLGSAIFHGFMCTYLIYEMTHEHQDYTCLDKAYYGLGTSYFRFEKIGLFVRYGHMSPYFHADVHIQDKIFDCCELQDCLTCGFLFDLQETSFATIWFLGCKIYAHEHMAKLMKVRMHWA